MPVKEKIDGNKNEKLDKGIQNMKVGKTKTLSSNKIHKLVKILRNEILNRAEDFYNSKKYEEAVNKYEVLIYSHCK